MGESRNHALARFWPHTLCFVLGAGGCGGGGSSDSGGSDATGQPHDQTVTLAWDAPTLTDDGTPLMDLAGYRVYDGSSPGRYTTITDVGTKRQFTTAPYPPGTRYFAVTAYNTSGQESAFSNEVSVTLPLEP